MVTLTFISDYSRQKGMTHQQIYQYHPQANPAERVMKPLGKTQKTATMDHKTEQEALKEFLVSYHANPHIATGVPPSDFLFRDGYRADYPFRKPIDKEQVANARDYDQSYKEAIQDKTNKSVKRPRTAFKSETRYCQRTALVQRSLSLNFIQHRFWSQRLGIMAYSLKTQQMKRHLNVTRMM